MRSLRSGVLLALCVVTGLVTVAHRTIERIIGRLLTDQELRGKFMRAPRRTLAELGDQGWELTRVEVDALVAIETRLWSDVAVRIDPRLHRTSSRTDE
jgi:hypothetical protein